MKKIKTSDPKYPLEVELGNGARILIARQSRFSDPWLKAHGCSLVAEFEALQYIGVSKKKHWPIYLEDWHRDHTPEEIFAKVTVRGVAQGINELGAGKGSATYSKNVTAYRIKTALKAGALVIVERAKPIHTIVLVQDGEAVYRLDAGKATKTTPEAAAKSATTSKRYRGMIIVRRKNG